MPQSYTYIPKKTKNVQKMTILCNYSLTDTNPLPLSLLVLGLVSMTVALFFDAHWLSAVGGLLLAVAQLLNWHFYRKVKICCTHA